MRRLTVRKLKTRRAVAAALFGLMLPVFIGMTSLAVDVAMITTARAQLRVAADAAALAAAPRLVSENRVRGSSTLSAEISGANTQAYAFARKNQVLNDAPVLSTNASNATSGDILVGYLDWRNPNSTLDSSVGMTAQYNSVQVTLRRDAQHGGLVPTIFASLMGFKGSSVTVSSTATVQNFSVAGVKSDGSSNVNLLPIVLEKTNWQAMMDGLTVDQYSYNLATGAVTSGSDGVAESQLYPVRNGSPGNWGTIKVGVSNNSTSTLSSQIQYGITPQQMATFPGGVIALDSTKSPPSYTFSGNPGISAGIKSALNAIIGKPVMVPIYDQNGGNGNNAWYRVIAFQPSRILAVNFQGSNKYVIIQPCLLDDSNLTKGDAQDWSKGGSTGVFLSR
jgi:Flp pilus assembly protein TadG